MRVRISTLLVLVAAACAGSPPVPRAAVVPPLAIETSKVQPEQRVYSSADRSPPTPPAFDQQDDDLATVPVYRTVVHTVEVPTSSAAAAQDPDQGGEYVDPRYYDYVERQRTPRPRRTTWFPVNTAIGAGVGAIIGNQSGRRDKGALIGGGVGLLFDLARWTR